MRAVIARNPTIRCDICLCCGQRKSVIIKKDMCTTAVMVVGRRHCVIVSPIPVSVLICGSKICFAITSLLATSIVADEIEVEIIWLTSLKDDERETLLLLSVLHFTTLKRLCKADALCRQTRATTMTTMRHLETMIEMVLFRF